MNRYLTAQMALALIAAAVWAGCIVQIARMLFSF